MVSAQPEPKLYRKSKCSGVTGQGRKVKQDTLCRKVTFINIIENSNQIKAVMRTTEIKKSLMKWLEKVRRLLF